MKNVTFYLPILDLDVGLWFNVFTKINSILVPNVENISYDPVQFSMWLIYFSRTVELRNNNSKASLNYTFFQNFSSLFKAKGTLLAAVTVQNFRKKFQKDLNNNSPI